MGVSRGIYDGGGAALYELREALTNYNQRMAPTPVLFPIFTLLAPVLTYLMLIYDRHHAFETMITIPLASCLFTGLIVALPALLICLYFFGVDRRVCADFYYEALQRLQLNSAMVANRRAPFYFRNLTHRLVYYGHLPNYSNRNSLRLPGTRLFSPEIRTLRAYIGTYFRECGMAGIPSHRRFDEAVVLLLWLLGVISVAILIFGMVTIIPIGVADPAAQVRLFFGFCALLNVGFLHGAYTATRSMALVEATEQYLDSAPAYTGPVSEEPTGTLYTGPRGSGVARPASTDADWESERNSMYDKTGWS